MNISRYYKTIAAVLSVVAIVLQTEYAHNQWANAVIAGIGALLVYLVPNSGKN
jgi:hypothetical protein